jgi:pimeloyl-ACP methyl ester carboxylesterase
MPFVQAGEVRLHYVEHGSGPEPLVFVHGYTGSSRNWEELYTRIPDGYRAICIDLRGAGESDKPASGYGPAIYARDIDAATRALGLDTFTLIGHSMGGVTAMQFAVSYRERLRKLVLVAPAPSGGITFIDPSMREQSKAMRANREARLKLAHAMEARPMTDEAILRRIEDDLKWPEAAYDEAWQAMVDIRLSDEIARLDVPTLMVAGDRDGLRAANLADAQRIPNCALHVFYRVGHEVAADVPDEFMALLDDFIRHGVAPAVSWEQRRQMLNEMLRAQTTPA